MKLKKKIGALILCAMIAGTMTVSMTACGSSSTTSTAASSSATNNNATLQTYLDNNPDFVETMKSSFASTGADSLATCEVVAEDGNLVLKITYKDQATVTSDVLTAMESSIDSIKDTMTAMASALHTATGLNDAKVIIRYINKDGSDILTITATDSNVTYTEGKVS